MYVYSKYFTNKGHPEKLVQDLHVHEVPDVCSEVVIVQEVFEGDNLIDR
jgi:ssDNA-binding replication factor A large subunit